MGILRGILLPLLSSKGLMHPRDRHPALAHCGGTALNGAGANVADGKNAWLAGFQWPRQTAHGFPGRGAYNSVAGFNETLFVAIDLGGKPGGAWLCADHGKDGGGLDGAPFVRLEILQLDGLEDFRAHHSPYFSMSKDFDVALCLDAAREIAGHARCQIFAADYQEDFLGSLGQKHRGLP